MQHITLLGLLSDRAEILDYLQSAGAVQLSPVTYTEEEIEEDRAEDEQTQILHKQLSDLRAEDLRLAEQQEQRTAQSQQQLRRVIDTINKRFPELKPKPEQLEFTETEFLQIGNEADKLLDEIYDFEKLIESEQNLQAEIDKLVRRQSVLERWQSLPLDLKDPGTETTQWFPGLIDKVKLEEFLSGLAEVTEYADLIELPAVEESSFTAGILVTMRSETRQIGNYLKSSSFNLLPVKDVQGSAQEILTKDAERASQLRSKLKDTATRLQELAQDQIRYMQLYDFLQATRERLSSRAKMDNTRYTFTVKGWIAKDRAEQIERYLTDKFTVAIDFKDVKKGEEHPIALKNPPFLKEYEVILEMFGAPDVKEVDPTPIMAPFNFLFFGMMLSDVGYGLLLSIITGYMVFVRKVRGEAAKMSRMLLLSGFSSIIWGFVFGGFFGDLIKVVTQGALDFKPLWFNPMEDPMKLMIWSMLFGIVHIFFGMGIRMYNDFLLGDWQSAIFDIAPWYLIITGLGLMLAAPQLIIGKYLAILGVAIVVLFAGRGTWNPIKRLLKGLLGLYNVTGFLGDILSYSRILALVLATSVIAMVVNLIGFMPGPGVVGYTMLLVVGVFGHSVNLALSALSAYVHSSRLQYVEFFGRFFQGGGKFFKPLDYQTEYVNITKRDYSAAKQ